MMTGLVQLFLVSIALIQWFTRLDFGSVKSCV